jgi:DNA-binding NarL/FixJ family response regulator
LDGIQALRGAGHGDTNVCGRQAFDSAELQRYTGRVSEPCVIRLILVEDQPIILRRQRRLLERFEEVEVVGEARDGASALKLAEAEQPDVVLLDLGLPDKDGIVVTREIKARWPKMEILIFTIFEEEKRVLEAVRAGASGYLLKGTAAERIVEAIGEVHAGGSVIQPRLARRLLRHFMVDQPQGRRSPPGRRRSSSSSLRFPLC